MDTSTVAHDSLGFARVGRCGPGFGARLAACARSARGRHTVIARLADPRDPRCALGQIQFRPRASLEGEVAATLGPGRSSNAQSDSRHEQADLSLGLMLCCWGPILVSRCNRSSGWPRFELWIAAVKTSTAVVDRDDGMLVMSRRGSDVQRLAIYEDLDGSRSYSAGDVLRFDRSGRASCSNRLPPA